MVAVTLLASCSTQQPPQQAPPAPKGPRTVEGTFLGGGPFEEFDFKGGTLIASPNFDKPYSMEAKYADGTVTDVASYYGVNHCPNLLKSCAEINFYSSNSGMMVSRDGRSWLDSELWAIPKDEPHPVGPAFLGMSRSSPVVTFQGCKDGKIYSSGNLSSLMSVLENEKSADAGTPPASGVYDSKTEREVYVVGDVDSTRMPVCNWRHRIGLDKLLPAPKSTMAKLVPASEKTPQHVEVTTDKGVIDWFANNTPLDLMTIKLPNGHSISIKPRYGSPNCPDFANCREVALTRDSTTVIQQALDGQPMNKTRLWKLYNPDGGPATYAACAGGTYFSGRNRAQVEAALAGADKKSSPQQDMVLDEGSGSFVPANVAAVATPMCDWAQRDKVYQKMIDAAKKARKDAADSTSGQD